MPTLLAEAHLEVREQVITMRLHPDLVQDNVRRSPIPSDPNVSIVPYHGQISAFHNHWQELQEVRQATPRAKLYLRQPHYKRGLLLRGSTARGTEVETKWCLESKDELDIATNVGNSLQERGSMDPRVGQDHHTSRAKKHQREYQDNPEEWQNREGHKSGTEDRWTTTRQRPHWLMGGGTSLE